MTRLFSRLAMLASALALPGLTACSPGMLTGQQSSLFNRSAPATNDGTILSMRSATTADNQASSSQSGSGMGGGWSSMLAAGMGGGAMSGMGGGALSSMTAGSPAAGPMPHGPGIAFELRMDDGSTITVVQDHALGLHPGDRVEVIHGDRTRLVPAG